MLKSLYQDLEDSMKKAVEVLRKEFAAMRAGRATPALLDRIQVDYYGVPAPITQLANVNVPEPRLLVIQPWDKSSIEAIERAIQKSDLGMPPNSDGNVIRLVVPQLTEERRHELAKVIRKKAEEARVAVRNIRRSGNDSLKELEKEGEISEDEQRRAADHIQELTDQYIAEIDKVLKAKEDDIMEV